MIELSNISFSYENRKIIDNLSLRIEKGEKVGIMGKSGCGKSTLLRLMAGLYKADNGIIRVDGETEPDKICGKVSVVMQSPMLLPLSIRDNITMGHDYSKEWVEKAVLMAGLSRWVDTLPDRLDTYIGDRADELSGGQAQRIAIARAMCKDAKVLFLDEPASALDSDNTMFVLNAISEYAKDKTVVHVSHRPEHLNGYDRVLIFDNGVLRTQM